MVASVTFPMMDSVKIQYHSSIPSTHRTPPIARVRARVTRPRSRPSPRTRRSSSRYGDATLSAPCADFRASPEIRNPSLCARPEIRNPGPTRKLKGIFLPLAHARFVATHRRGGVCQNFNLGRAQSPESVEHTHNPTESHFGSYLVCGINEPSLALQTAWKTAVELVCTQIRARLPLGEVTSMSSAAAAAPWDRIPDVHDFLSAPPVRSGVRSTGRARAVKPSVRT